MLGIAIFYRDEPVNTVNEYAEIELRLSNTGTETLAGCALKLGGQTLRGGFNLAPGSAWSLNYRLDDLAGELLFQAIAGSGEKAEARLTVSPVHLSMAELNYIKIERLPGLLSRLNAPNGLNLGYGDDKTPDFSYISADYTAEKLLYFSHELEVSTNNVRHKLDYQTPEKLEGGSGLIKGNVRWSETTRQWLNQPQTRGIEHRWTTAPKSFATLPNLLLVRFHRELENQLEQLGKLIVFGIPASAELRATLPQISGLADYHRSVSEWPVLAELVNRLDEVEDQEIEKACFQCKRPEYEQLWLLWDNFRQKFVRLPQDEEKLARCSLQPTARIYELWVACEVALALELEFVPKNRAAPYFGLESATFQNGKYSLYYNQGARGGWYSGSRQGVARPDLRLVRASDKAELWLDVKYRVEGNGQRPAFEDSYKMLAYLNDFKIGAGAIVYPGRKAPLKINRSETGQALIEIPLRPTTQDRQQEFSAQLRSIILDQIPY